MTNIDGNTQPDAPEVAKQVAPYGAWKSPVSTDLLFGKMIGLGGVTRLGANIYWTESRPAEAGRNVPVELAPDGTTRDLLPLPWNVRTRVHEYGGGAALFTEDTYYFVNFADQRLYQLDLNNKEATPQPISSEQAYRYADFTLDAPRQRLLCVREDHTAGESEPVNTIVAVGLKSGVSDQVLCAGKDFYSSPRLSPNGRQFAWLQWSHPNMPWDGTELWLADVDEAGNLSNQQLIAGGKEESIFQPEFAPDDTLYFVSDRTGWWNIYRFKNTLNAQIEAICPMEAEFGLPQWVFGMRTYTFINNDELLAVYSQDGIAHLIKLDVNSGNIIGWNLPFSEYGNPVVVGNQAYLVASRPENSSAVIRLNLDNGQYDILKSAMSQEIDPAYISIPQGIEFPTTGGLTAYGLYYPPSNADYTAPKGELPPLLVKSHGGPTSAATTQLNFGIQYWTSRGFAVLDVNYGGSTGYGRAYRERLKPTWGIVDVDDCANGAKYLVEQKLADPERLAITGGSAGGYTTLAALTFRDVFKAGASHYGISDMEALAKDTHKFESRYTDMLVGAYPAELEIYIARSPIHHTDKLSTPLILFQGLEDKVVPPAQSQLMYEAVKAKGLPVAYVAFEGEQHGFRKAENIKRALEGEFYFYSRLFGFAPADSIEPVAIHNLD